MPKDIALNPFKAHQAKRIAHPDMARSVIYKHLLWDLFAGRMIMDQEIDRMASDAANLLELTIIAVKQLKPQFQDPKLDAAMRRELKQYFMLNMPEALK